MAKQKYYVNDNVQPTGDYEVHKEGCKWLVLVLRKTYLGEHETCQTAVAAAKKIYPTADGCATCSAECHRR